MFMFILECMYNSILACKLLIHCWMHVLVRASQPRLSWPEGLQSALGTRAVTQDYFLDPLSTKFGIALIVRTLSEHDPLLAQCSRLFELCQNTTFFWPKALRWSNFVSEHDFLSSPVLHLQLAQRAPSFWIKEKEEAGVSCCKCSPNPKPGICASLACLGGS